MSGRAVAAQAVFLWIDSARRLLQRSEPLQADDRQPRLEADLGGLRMGELDFDGGASPVHGGGAPAGRRLSRHNSSIRL